MNFIVEPLKQISVVEEPDVLVVGGGPAGVGAAIAAARAGASTLVVEMFGCLGGLATSGLHFHLCKLTGEGTDDLVIKGIPLEISQRLMGKNAATLKNGNLDYDVEILKYELDLMMKENAVKTLLHTFAAGVIKDGSRIDSVILESKSGRMAVKPKFVIDCTGDGDVAYHAGAPYEKGRKLDGRMQPVTLMFRLRDVDAPMVFEYRKSDRRFTKAVHKAVEAGDMPLFEDCLMGLWWYEDRMDELGINFTNQTDIDSTNVYDLTKAEIVGREQVQHLCRFFRKYIPGMENCRLVDTAQYIGIRESRRFIGDYVLTEEDVLEARQFEDNICQNSFPVDIHAPVGTGVYFVHIKGGKSHGIPYRCLTPKGIDNLFVAGRNVSATHEALGSIRVMYPCMAMGEAAGTAAGMCIRAGCTTRNLNMKELQQELVKNGVVV